MNIHISNLDIEVTEAEILSLLAAYSSVGHCAIHYIKNFTTHQADTYAIIDMSTDSDAQASVKLLDGSTLGGHKISVQIGH